MGILGLILIILFVIAAFFVGVFVLLQDDQGDGIGGMFGGGGSNSFGAVSGNILTKITSYLGAAFLILSLAVAFAIRTSDKDSVEEEAKKAQAEQDATQDWFEVDEIPAGGLNDSGAELVIPEGE